MILANGCVLDAPYSWRPVQVITEEDKEFIRVLHSQSKRNEKSTMLLHN
jgi:hypothetical protein